MQRGGGIIARLCTDPPKLMESESPHMLDNLFILTMVLASVLISSFVASLIPGRAVPEVVFFVFAGAIGGPNLLGIFAPTEAMELLSRLGMGFLFLMAGYELNPRELLGKTGRQASASWLLSMGIALLVVPLTGLDVAATSAGTAAFAIGLTTTAYGTLVPILADRGIAGTRVGKVIEAYGAMGELLPVIAMSVLLSPGGRSQVMSIGILVAFVAFCLLLAQGAGRVKKFGGALYQFLSKNAESTSQPVLRTTILLLVWLLFLSELMELDAVLGAFATGFILRTLVPEEDTLATKISTVANGFFLPVFFVCSGMSINFSEVFSDLSLVAIFMGLLLLVRTLPVLASLTFFKDTRSLDLGERISISLYCTMALPLIVALTEVAVNAGVMTEHMASVLITSGAFTVLIIPVLTALTRNVLAAHPVEAVREIARNPRAAGEITRTHADARRLVADAYRDERRTAREEGRHLSPSAYLAHHAEEISHAIDDVAEAQEPSSE